MGRLPVRVRVSLSAPAHPLWVADKRLKSILVAGDEVVQLYIRDDGSSVITYEKVLRGFERVGLKPGQTQTVTFTVPASDLAILDRSLKRVVEPGTFTVMVGSSSEDIRLTGHFEMKANRPM